MDLPQHSAYQKLDLRQDEIPFMINTINENIDLPRLQSPSFDLTYRQLEVLGSKGLEDVPCIVLKGFESLRVRIEIGSFERVLKSLAALHACFLVNSFLI